MAFVLNRNPDQRTLRQFGLLCSVLLLAVASWQVFHNADRVRVLLLVAAGLFVGIIALLRTNWLRPVFVGWMVAVFPIGWLVSHAILAFIFYGVIMPIGLVLRLCGRDALRLKRPETASFWEDCRESSDLRRYFRQY